MKLLSAGGSTILRYVGLHIDRSFILPLIFEAHLLSESKIQDALLTQSHRFGNPSRLNAAFYSVRLNIRNRREIRHIKSIIRSDRRIVMWQNVRI